jgi:hypothetical protein
VKMATPGQGVIPELLFTGQRNSIDPRHIKKRRHEHCPLAPIQRLIRDVTGDLHVVVAATEQGYRETALEACLLAQEKLLAIRKELLRPGAGNR